MNRNEFMRLATSSVIGATCFGAKGAIGATPTREFDRFGGWTGKQFEATGFFRVEKADRWWIVTPDGNAFLSWGVNHLEPHLWNQNHNREFWEKRFKAKATDRQAFATGLRSWYLDICKQYGFNTAGVHTNLPVLNTPQPALPYMRPVRFLDIPHWKPEIPDTSFLDVFSPEFAKHCDRMAKQLVGPVKDDPFLLGYSMTDCPMFTEEDCRERPDVIGGARRKARIGWPRRLRNFDTSSPGKKAYVRTVKRLYRGQIQEFNATYATSFDSFDSLADAKDWRPETDLSNGNETRDNIEFLKVAVNQYYTIAKEAIRRYDTNHMFVGDKINANTDSMDTVLPVTSQFTDIVMYQMYGRYEVQKPGLDRWSAAIDKPFINGDSAFTMTTATMPRPYGPVADDLQQRALWTEEFFRQTFARPEFVGWHYCGLIDATNLIALKKARQHSGLLTETGDPYPLLEHVIQTCAKDLYQIATN